MPSVLYSASLRARLDGDSEAGAGHAHIQHNGYAYLQDACWFPLRAGGYLSRRPRKGPRPSSGKKGWAPPPRPRRDSEQAAPRRRTPADTRPTLPDPPLQTCRSGLGCRAEAVRRADVQENRDAAGRLSTWTRLAGLRSCRCHVTGRDSPRPGGQVFTDCSCEEPTSWAPRACTRPLGGARSAA